MAKIQASSNEKIISLKVFLGLNENPDGDNKLKMGEATVCRNFKITDNGNLKKRAGTVLKYTLGDDKPIKGLWHGWCTHHELFMAACDGKLWMLQDDEMLHVASPLGNISTTNDVFMFGFDEKVYAMDGQGYYEIKYVSSATSATAYADVSAENPDSTLSAASVVAATFANKMKYSGVYKFVLGSNGWTVGQEDYITDAKLASDYGITFTGIPALSDYITVEFTAASAGYWSMTNLCTSGESGYWPIVAKNIVQGASGGGVLNGEEVNKLNSVRRVWINANGSEQTYVMPEYFTEIKYIKDLITNTTLAGTAYTYTLSDGKTNTFSFTSAPSESVPNSYEVCYKAYGSNFASTVGAMRYAELYAGTQDNRVFVYGDGSNRTFYTGLDQDGHPRGDYFPDLYEVTVGDSNTPITALIRHYSKMLALKPEQTYSIDYGIITLDDGYMTPAFYTTPINKIIGNEPMGQVMLVLNAPISICQGNLYEWRNGSAYSANISVDERQAKRISDRISATLRTMDLATVHCYDDNLNSEYYIIDDKGKCLVHNYRSDAWYTYEGLNARMIISVDGVPWIGTHDGKILMMDENARSDCGVPIDCYWESGSMDLGASNMRKYISQLWISIKPEEHNKITVTSKTERSIENTEVEVEPDYENFMPRTTRCKIKTKKFVFYKLCFVSNDAQSSATVVDAEIKVRYTAQAK